MADTTKISLLSRLKEAQELQEIEKKKKEIEQEVRLDIEKMRIKDMMQKTLAQSQKPISINSAYAQSNLNQYVPPYATTTTATVNSPTNKYGYIPYDMMSTPFDSINSKNPFEVIVDEIFDTSEKEQYLIGIGYRIEQVREGNPISDPLRNLFISKITSDGRVQVISSTLDSLFLKEISLKFKSILLKKEVLKLKF